MRGTAIDSGMPGPVLVVAATVHELAPSGDWIGVVCGVGPVEAASVSAAAIACHRPSAVLHVGVAGARTASGISPLQVVIGSGARYADLGVPAHLAPAHLTPDASLVTAVRRALPHVLEREIGTSGRVGGTSGCDVEAMEGFAVLRAAELAGLPAIEVRVISNHVEEGDRAKWQLAEAFAVVREITPAIVAEVAACVR
jgi:futalosine hydrolase